MGYFSSDKKEAKGASCKFTLIKKKYTCVYLHVRFFYYTIFIFHFKCMSVIVKLIFLVLNFSKKKERKIIIIMNFESGPLA